MKRFWCSTEAVVVEDCECTKCHKFYTLKQSIVYYVTFSKKKILFNLKMYEIDIYTLLFIWKVTSYSLWPHGLQHASLPCPSLSPRVCSNSCPWSWWCYLTISSSVYPFSFCLRYFPSSGSFPMSGLFASGGQATGTSASASVLPMYIQDWFPLWLIGLISLQYKGLSRVFSSTTIQIYDVDSNKDLISFFFFGLQNQGRWWLQAWN